MYLHSYIQVIIMHTLQHATIMGWYKTWTLDSGLDYGLHYRLDYGLDYRLDFGQDSKLNSRFQAFPLSST